jgi:hypothetical protein
MNPSGNLFSDLILHLYIFFHNGLYKCKLKVKPEIAGLLVKLVAVAKLVALVALAKLVADTII